MSTPVVTRNEDRVRLRLTVQGAVQGVGFRPFLYRLAKEIGLDGWVSNSANGVCVEIEGKRTGVEQFHHRLEREAPPRSLIQSCDPTWLEAAGYEGFEIRPSDSDGDRSTLVLPDLATCPDCLQEITDPANRRHRYPFTNCTNCGPRFSILNALPYDRSNTSMRTFRMCPACQAEYDDPTNRRFHAQPNACPECGPQLELWNGAGPDQGGVVERDDAALRAAVDAIRSGKIVAVKGIGGFHLMVDASNAEAVETLRERKRREEKPFALMFPSLESIETVCDVSPLAIELLTSPAAPIVLLSLRRSTPASEAASPIADSVAPGNPNLGAMLPSNPLHHLLMTELGRPVVATSGNCSDEPICTDELEALDRLKGIADLFLVHNRPIVRHIDDSIVRIMMDKPMVLRRARGYAPLPVTLTENIDGADSGTTLAVGAHLKNTVALAVRNQVFLSQHIGDLETEQAHHAFRRSASDLPTLYDSQPVTVVADQHPDYSSTRFAVTLTTPKDTERGRSTAQPELLQVQHHLAHFFSCIADNRITLPALGVAWDGTGYGSDGSIWGGEFFRADARLEQRVAHLEPFELPGGDAAIREPRRAAYALLHALRPSDPRLTAWREGWVRTVFTAPERKTLDAMLERGMNSPKCTSIGRLFDAIASMIGVRHRSSFEGQAAMELEFAIGDLQTEDHYGLPINSTPGSPRVLRWLPLVESIVSDVIDGVDAGLISARFHNSLAEAIVHVADQVGEQRVALTGGCFQNSYLIRRTVTRLREAGFQPFWHHQVPPNDGGIALGQVVAEARHRARNLEPRVPQDRPNHH